MSKRKKPVYIYEVSSPMPYCEIYLVKATSKREARELFEAHGVSNFECIGEISSLRKTERRIRKVKA